MRYQKLAPQQKMNRNWRIRRSHLVCKLLDEDKSLPREEALRHANKMMRGG